VPPVFIPPPVAAPVQPAVTPSKPPRAAEAVTAVASSSNNSATTPPVAPLAKQPSEKKTAVVAASAAAVVAAAVATSTEPAKPPKPVPPEKPAKPVVALSAASQAAPPALPPNKPAVDAATPAKPSAPQPPPPPPPQPGGDNDDDEAEMTLDDVPFYVAKPKEQSFRSLQKAPKPDAAVATPQSPPPPGNPFAPEVQNDAVKTTEEEGATVAFAKPNAAQAPEMAMSAVSMDTTMLMAPRKNKLFSRPALRRFTLVDGTVRYYDKTNKQLGTFSILEAGFTLKGRVSESSPTKYEMTFQPQNVTVYPANRPMLEEWAAAVENNLSLLHGLPDLGPENPASFYEVLQVSRDVTSEGIRHAYQELASQFADDEERLDTLLQAYTSLMEPELRGVYDRADSVRRALRGGVLANLKNARGDGGEPIVLFADAEVTDLFWQGVRYGPKLSPKYQWLELRNVHRTEPVGECDVRLHLDESQVVLAMDSTKTRDALLECLAYFCTAREMREQQQHSFKG